MVSTRTTRDARTTKPSTAAKDLELNTETKLPRKIPNTGPSTASAVAPANARNTRSSSRKKPAANAGRTGSAQIVNRVGKDTPSDEPTEPVRLEDKFELAAMDEVSTKKRTNVEVIEFDEDEPAPQQRRVTRARGRASTGTHHCPLFFANASAQTPRLRGDCTSNTASEPDPPSLPDPRKADATPTETAVVNLTCDERLVAERGFALASVEEVGAAEDVYPFSTKGGRRSNERKHALTPYVENGDLFSAAMRQDLVDWMSCQHASLDLADETFHLALRYLDTFLLRRGPENFLARNGAGSEPVPALVLGALPSTQAVYLEETHQPLCNKLKRLGITCVFVAAKVVEVCAPSACSFSNAAEVSTFSKSQLLLAERALLRELEYDLYLPTSSSFSGAYLSCAQRDIKNNGYHAKNVAKWNNARGVSLGSKKSLAVKLETETEKQVRYEETCEVVEFVLEACTVARDGVQYPPSLIAAATIGWVMSRNHACEWATGMQNLQLVSGYSSEQVGSVFGFLDKVVLDFAKAELRQRGGFYATEKHGNAVELLWGDRVSITGFDGMGLPRIS